MATKGYKGLVKLNKVVAALYIPHNPKVAILVAQGGPGFGDNLKSDYWKVCEENSSMLMIPDYLGHARSDGKFSFENCINALYECIDFLNGKQKAIDGLTSKKVAPPKIQETILLGSSWGGAIAPFINKYRQTKIKKLVLIAPVTDWSTLGNGEYVEETIEETENLINNVMNNIYRGYSKSNWRKIFHNKKYQRTFNPLDNIKLLKDMEVFVFHGTRDKSIHWTRSRKYTENIKASGIAKKVELVVLPNSPHGKSTKSKALRIYFNSWYN